jgi:hypothetical protein
METIDKLRTLLTTIPNGNRIDALLRWSFVVESTYRKSYE